mgnify:CR=1 FL=1
MSDNNSPLKKYQRKPKLYIDLPSKGQWYPPGALTKSTELAVYSMTASDEIATKTPDSLFNGETTVGIVQSCIPDIKNAWQMPIIDLYACLAAIRMASYGTSLSVTTGCAKCQEESSYDISLQGIVDYYQSCKFIDHSEHEGFVFDISPLSLKEINDISLRSFRLQRQIAQNIPKIEDEVERDKELQTLYDQLMNINVGTVVQHITKITTDENEEESDINAIAEFIQSAEKGFYGSVQKLVTTNNKTFALPENNIECPACGHKDNLVLDLDYSNFFEQYL